MGKSSIFKSAAKEIKNKIDYFMDNDFRGGPKRYRNLDFTTASEVEKSQYIPFALPELSIFSINTNPEKLAIKPGDTILFIKLRKLYLALKNGQYECYGNVVYPGTDVMIATREFYDWWKKLPCPVTTSIRKAAPKLNDQIRGLAIRYDDHGIDWISPKHFTVAIEECFSNEELRNQLNTTWQQDIARCDYITKQYSP